MVTVQQAFSSFSVDDLDVAETFYGRTLGLDVRRTPMGLELDVTGGAPVFVYPKGADHAPAIHTVLNLVVADVTAAAHELRDVGVDLERFPGMPQDDDGVMRSEKPSDGPTIGWFRDPAGNTIALIQD